MREKVRDKGRLEHIIPDLKPWIVKYLSEIE